MTKENNKKEENIEQKNQTKNIKFSIDINALVEKTRAMYSKKETGLSEQLTTGEGILLSKKDDTDFIVWTDNDYFKTLTSQRGVPMGKILQFSGRSDSGKSSHAYMIMRQAMEQNVITVLWDSEKKFNAVRFNKMGGSAKDLLLIHTNNIIDGAKHMANYIHAAKEMDPNVKILIVIDSIGACVNSSEDNEENEDMSKQPGVTARETSWLIRKISKLINKYFNKETGKESLAFVIVNQTYSSIGVGPSIQVEKGGNALYYMSSLILQLSRKQDLTKIKNGVKYKYGICSRVRVKKNHLFEGSENIGELDIIVTADGIKLAKEAKNDQDIQGWDSLNEEDED